MAAFGQINSFNSTFFKGGNPFINKTVCDYIDTSLFNYTQYVYTSTNKTGTFYLNPTVDTTVYILAIGGGGGGGGNYAPGGGGGAGGFVETYYNVLKDNPISIRVNVGNGGGICSPGDNTTLKFKGGSSYADIIAYGGGGGGVDLQGVDDIKKNGASGGGSIGNYGKGNRKPGTNDVISAQGYDGANDNYSGGGGGAGGFGSVYNPGFGKTPSLEAFNTNIYYCSGGSGAYSGTIQLYSNLPGGGGRGQTAVEQATSGKPNTGGGGGATYNSIPGSGGSGIVIISIKNEQNDFFSNVSGNMFLSSSIDNNYYLFSFTSSGSFTLNNDVSNCKCLIVGGGGAGGCYDLYLGGGGGGQVVIANNVTINKNFSNTITVGLGGYHLHTTPSNITSTLISNNYIRIYPKFVNSGSSSIVTNTQTITATGGGYAAYNNGTTILVGQDGGSGGAGGMYAKAGKANTVANTLNITYLGCSGTMYVNSNSLMGAGGGGGATTNGKNRNSTNMVSGGVGYTWDLNNETYGGGGGGYYYVGTSVNPEYSYFSGFGGGGGGGESYSMISSGLKTNNGAGSPIFVSYGCNSLTWGKPNTGGGGGGTNISYLQIPVHGKGGSGVVIIAIPKTNFSQNFINRYNIDQDYRQLSNSRWLSEWGYKNSLYTFNNDSIDAMGNGTLSSAVIKNMYTNIYDFKINTTFKFISPTTLFTSTTIPNAKYIYGPTSTDSVGGTLPHMFGYSQEFSMFARISGPIDTPDCSFNFKINDNNNKTVLKFVITRTSVVFTIITDDNSEINISDTLIPYGNNLYGDTFMKDIGFTINNSSKTINFYYDKNKVSTKQLTKSFNYNFFSKTSDWSIYVCNMRFGPIGTYAKELNSYEYKCIVTYFT